jgi:hypothetical protein
VYSGIAVKSNLGYNAFFGQSSPKIVKKNTEFTEQKAGFAHLIGGSKALGAVWSIRTRPTSRSKGAIPLLLG